MRKKIIWIIVFIIIIFIGIIWYNSATYYNSTSAGNIKVIQKSEDEDDLPHWITIENELGEQTYIEVPNNSIWRLIRVGEHYTVTYSYKRNTKPALEHIAPGDYNGRID